MDLDTVDLSSRPSSRPTSPAPDAGPNAGRRGPRRRDPLWRDLIGEVLRGERQAQDRTLQEVADAARISMPYLSELERGRKEASSEILAAAARALGLRLSDLINLAHSRLGDYEAYAAAGSAKDAVGVGQGVAGANAAGTNVAGKNAAAAVMSAGQGTYVPSSAYGQSTKSIGVLGSRDAVCLAA